ncbi:MAG: MltA domain-containing protein [Deltaproteobacteria bacterium]|nr:MltA domain-containing protein [Deltaproteobacteria bacterium]
MPIFYYIKLGLFILFIIVIGNGCSTQKAKYPDTPSPRQIAALSSKNLILESKPFLEIFKGDDLTRQSLNNAIAKSLVYLKRISPSKIFHYGKLKYTTKEVIASMMLFQKLINSDSKPEEIFEQIQKSFFVFRSPSNAENKVLFTGYYEPVYKGSLKKTKYFNVPVYKKPSDLAVLNLGRFRRSLKSRTIVYRVSGNKILPYYTRREIMMKKKLANKKMEIAWMKDPVDLFFLQVQGSGIIQLPNGKRMKLSYNGSNGHPYSSIGKLLIDDGKMTLEEVSMSSIRSYIKKHPELKDYILYHNKSYTFFDIGNAATAPKGNINVPLTPERSIATDSFIFPKGGLAYIITEKPVFDKQWNYIDSEPLNRFALNQDTGGAIKGTGRVDIFWGNGSKAEKSAGMLRSFGQIYFLIAKKEVIQESI